jgi:two-component system, NarL family, sensor kinase
MEADRQAHPQLHERLTELLQQQRELVERLQQGQEYFQQLARSVWRVQEDERRRLARELHDGIGQNLTALINLIGQARSASGDLQQAKFDSAQRLAESTLQDTRALSRMLRPQILDDLGLEAALSWLTRTLGEAHTLQIKLELTQPLPIFDGDMSTLIFRVVQEALTNAVRHAQASVAQVLVRRRGTRVMLDIRDDGRGCDADAALAVGSEGRSSGLGGMRDRVRLFGGEFRIVTAPGAGFALSIELPLSRTATRALP